MRVERAHRGKAEIKTEVRQTGCREVKAERGKTELEVFGVKIASDVYDDVEKKRLNSARASGVLPALVYTLISLDELDSPEGTTH